jgi:hypothetical protein
LSCPRKRDGLSNVTSRTRRARPSEGPNRRGTLVVPAEVGWIIQCYVTDATSASLRRAESEGHACRARGSGMDCPMLRHGRDERVPPKGGIGGARLSCPRKWDGLSNVTSRTRRARPSEGRNRRGTLVVPAEVPWIAKCYAADPRRPTCKRGVTASDLPIRCLS